MSIRDKIQEALQSVLDKYLGSKWKRVVGLASAAIVVGLMAGGVIDPATGEWLLVAAAGLFGVGVYHAELRAENQ